MHFDSRSQEHVRSLPFLEEILDIEALIFLREQMPGQTDAIHANGTQEKELLMRTENKRGKESILSVIRIED